jgi:hypothetical protein
VKLELYHETNEVSVKSEKKNSINFVFILKIQVLMILAVFLRFSDFFLKVLRNVQTCSGASGKAISKINHIMAPFRTRSSATVWIFLRNGTAV